MLKTFNILLLRNNSIVFRVKIESHKKWNLGYISLHFSEAILISFVKLNNGNRHFVIEMHKIHGGFRRMAENGFAPPLGNFADISYLVEN